jgi:Skp family chaperone for outer membrane proteins
MKRIVILAVACALAPAAMAQLYKYVDKDGKTVYSDQAPVNVDTKRLNIPEAQAPAHAPKTYLQRDKDLDKARDEVKEKSKKQDEAQRQAKAAEERCAQARNNLQVYQDGGRITKYENGERVYLGDAELEAERQRATQERDEACKKS